MRAFYRDLCKREEFCPGWMGIFVNGAYLFRCSLHRAVKKHAPFLGGTVVDFGCGQMPYRSLISADRYIGLDVLVSGHPAAGKLAHVYFDGARIPLKDASVDGMIAFEVFEHVFRPSRHASRDSPRPQARRNPADYLSLLLE